MPQAANIVINDGASTPVAHTFVPSKVSDLTTSFFGPGTTLAGREKITIVRREATATVAGKVSIKLETPVERVVDGATVVDYVDAGFLEFVVNPKSVKQHRKDLRVLASNLLLNASVAACIDDGDGLF